MADAATARKTLSNVYQEIITGACLLTKEQGINIRVSFKGTAPGLNDAFHPFNSNDTSFAYTGGLKVWARIDDSSFGTKTVLSYTGF